MAETTIQLGEITAAVVLKDIKNVHLSVYPPNGHVRIAAPARMTLDNIRAYAVTRLDWIKAQQMKLRMQERVSPRDYVSGESHFVWGKRYLLRVCEVDGPPHIELKARRMLLYARPGLVSRRREDIVEAWLRAQLRAAVPGLIAKWEPRLGVTVAAFHIQRMKTKWGSCSPERAAIRLNTELAKKPIECLEYIVVHEMVHLLERSHSDRFVSLMSQHIPKWKSLREDLNRLPVRHEDWKY